jgi:hypothetical protein
MVSSGRQMIVSVLLLVSAIVSANAQPAVDKGSISGKVTIGGKGVSGLVVVYQAISGREYCDRRKLS